MDVNTCSEGLNMICDGCLSSNRKILVCDTELSEVYYNFIDQPILHHRVSLCFECVAAIRKFMKFRKQLQNARTSIIEFMKCPYLMTSLSSLTVCHNSVETLPVLCDNQAETKDGLPYIKQEAECPVQVYVDSDRIVDDKQDIVEIPFIKQEEGSVQEYDDDKIMGNKIDLDISIDNDEHTDITDTLTVGKEAKKKIRNRKKIDNPNFYTKLSKHDTFLPFAGSTPGVVKNICVEKTLKSLNMSPELMEKVVLTSEQVEEERQKNLSSTVFTRNRYRCYDCVLGFDIKLKFDNHMKKHDASIGPLECNICKKRFADAKLFTAHTARVHTARWRCIPCGSLYTLVGRCADHIALVHKSTEAVPVHTCTVCGKVEKTFSKLRLHLRDHAEPQKCHICGKTLKDKSTLRGHLYRHNGIKDFACTKCDKKFFSKKALEIHMISHEKAQLYYCHECDKSFKSILTYNRHMKYNLKHIKPELLLQCSLCDNKFSTKQGLEHHKIAVHLKTDSYMCRHEGCHFVCSSRSRLRTHSRSHTDNQGRSRNKICHICGKGYMEKKTLECHMRTHTGERPYVCDDVTNDVTCSATFAYPSALYNHKKLVHCKIKRGRGKQTQLPDSDIEHST